MHLQLIKPVKLFYCWKPKHTSPIMKRKVQAQRKFAAGAYIPPSAASSAGPDRRADLTPSKEDRKIVVKTNMTPSCFLDFISFQNLHIKHRQPVVVLERMPDINPIPSSRKRRNTSPAEQADEDDRPLHFIAQRLRRETRRSARKPRKRTTLATNWAGKEDKASEAPARELSRRRTRNRTSGLNDEDLGGLDRPQKCNSFNRKNEKSEATNEQAPKVDVQSGSQDEPTSPATRKRVSKRVNRESPVAVHSPPLKKTDDTSHTNSQDGAVPSSTREPAGDDERPNVEEAESEFPDFTDQSGSPFAEHLAQSTTRKQSMVEHWLRKVTARPPEDVERDRINFKVPRVPHRRGTARRSPAPRPASDAAAPDASDGAFPGDPPDDDAPTYSFSRSSRASRANKCAEKKSTSEITCQPAGAAATERSGGGTDSPDEEARGAEGAPTHSLQDCPSQRLATVEAIVRAAESELRGRCAYCPRCVCVDKIRRLSRIVMRTSATERSDVYEFRVDGDDAQVAPRLPRFRRTAPALPRDDARRDAALPSEPRDPSVPGALAPRTDARVPAAEATHPPPVVEKFPLGKHTVELAPTGATGHIMTARLIPTNKAELADESSMIEHGELWDQLYAFWVVGVTRDPQRAADAGASAADAASPATLPPSPVPGTSVSAPNAPTLDTEKSYEAPSKTCPPPPIAPAPQHTHAADRSQRSESLTSQDIKLWYDGDDDDDERQLQSLPVPLPLHQASSRQPSSPTVSQAPSAAQRPQLVQQPQVLVRPLEQVLASLPPQPQQPREASPPKPADEAAPPPPPAEARAQQRLQPHVQLRSQPLPKQPAKAPPPQPPAQGKQRPQAASKTPKAGRLGRTQQASEPESEEEPLSSLPARALQKHGRPATPPDAHRNVKLRSKQLLKSSVQRKVQARSQRPGTAKAARLRPQLQAAASPKLPRARALRPGVERGPQPKLQVRLQPLPLPPPHAASRMHTRRSGDQPLNQAASKSASAVITKKSLRSKKCRETPPPRKTPADSAPPPRKTAKKSIEHFEASTEEPTTYVSDDCFREAPVFYPTEEEFTDPLAFFAEITRKASGKFGLCKVVAPKSFKPAFTLAEDVRFNVANQYLARLFCRWGAASREMCAIKAYLADQKVFFTRPPLIDGIELNLPKLYRTVQQHGGLKSVIERKRWGRVAEDMRVPRGSRSAQRIDQLYVKHLLPYDTLSAAERRTLLDKVERSWQRNYARMMRRALYPLHRQRRLLDESASSEEADSDAESDVDEHLAAALAEAEDCVVAGRHMKLSVFKKVGENVMSTLFAQPQPSPEQVEREYWRLVGSAAEHVCVNCASVDTGDEGYGFARTYKHPWNLKMLSQNSGNVLRSLGPVMGVTVPTLHLGMVLSTSCWHRDPHGLPWVEFLHHGPAKIWYGIPDELSGSFRSAVEGLCPTACQDKPIWLPSDITMIPPQQLAQRGVPLTRVVQRPGEFIVVMPKAFSSSISTGYTESESVYFATESWLEDVYEVFQELRGSCEPTMFSLAQLVLGVALDPRSGRAVLAAVQPALVATLGDELDHRRQLRDLGVEFVTPEVPRASCSRQSKKPAGAWNVRDQDECDICRTTLYLSKVSGLTGKRSALCPAHALRLLRGRRREPGVPPAVVATVFVPRADLEHALEHVRERLASSEP